ncbi:MAG: nucleotide exchange factor GrpE [Spirochaetia bacterium]|nr:nucleotide exchange factor GrpE [Spirochaetia bacterium]
MKKTEKEVKVNNDKQPESASLSTEEKGDAKQSSEEAIEQAEQQAEQIDDLNAQIDALKAENSELKNQYLRKQADFENFRKRMQREKQESIKYANSNLLQDLVTIIDDFERAIRSSEESRDFESFHSGIKMIEHQFVNMLERKYGLTRMESEGKEFDPQQHEAINMEESPEVGVQTVVEDYQKGYLLNDRVLRHAKVKVAIPAPEQTDNRQSGDEKDAEIAEPQQDEENRQAD